MFTTEHDYAAGRGCIGVRRSSDYQQLAELPSHGMDPHDIRLLADGQTLVVANGGIRTHPDFPRRELDIEHMASSLVYLRADSGALLDQQVLADRYLSMRHLAVLADGRVAVALQDRAPKRQASALLAVSRQQQSLQLLPLPAEQLAALQGYAADVVCDAERGVLAVSAARGNALVLWTYPQADFLTTVPVPDPGGLVVTAEGVQASSGAGGLWQLQTDGHAQQVLSAANYHWDNHALLL